MNDVATTIVFGKEHYHLQREMEQWCEQHIGKNDRMNWTFSEPATWEGLGDWCMASQFGNTFFYFKRDEDAMMFTLKWS